MGSQVCSLLWSKKERELLISHGFTQNQLTPWKYPSMVNKLRTLKGGHGLRVCSLLWSKKERELLSSHGCTQNQLTLPSMVKMAELTGHTSRVLFMMAQSPDGCTVASAAGDETLRFWNEDLRVYGAVKGLAFSPGSRWPQRWLQSGSNFTRWSHCMRCPALPLTTILVGWKRRGGVSRPTVCCGPASLVRRGLLGFSALILFSFDPYHLDR
ncbi:hypothetical protein MLD38_030326 [Melastoma candidum]|uniref:Uncharacterized protein n=1 Tax=Melastoma candidum TaxID=119954 RepID=A0ACB9MMJ3_9MYRT|nr:hypothetical protein MLD38_030326 [Melastoma candidum]